MTFLSQYIKQRIMKKMVNMNCNDDRTKIDWLFDTNKCI